MKVKNALLRLIVKAKNVALTFLRKWKFWQPLEETLQWSFSRLPPTFTAPLVVIAVSYYVLLYPVLVYRFVPWLLYLPARGVHKLFEFGSVSEMGRPGFVAATAYHQLLDIVSALLTLAIALAGIIVSYSLACFCYRCWRGLRRKARVSSLPRRVVSPRSRSTSVASAGADGPPAHNPLEGFNRIGIILAGGGAKGAYQAGAMKAVYEFIDEHGAHDKVKMIAGTSIGSWNALFWLADMVKDGVDEDGNKVAGELERWWRRVNVSEIIKPVKYLPTRQNFFLSNQPWQDTFDDLFKAETDAGKRLLEHMNNPDSDENLNFYFTCTNIERARLEVTTNDNERVTRRDPYLGGTDKLKNMNAKIAKNLEQLRFGVFSSMDLPPLFEYAAPMAGGNGNEADFYEDGGVIDNLPIYFGTEVEECDLLFILPLNASFEQEVNHRSLIRRLARVTNIRQGVLERKAFKDIYLFNESAYLRVLAHEQNAALRDVLGYLEDKKENLPEAEQLANKIEEVLVALPPEGGSAEELSPLQRALRRKHKPVQVFSICPKPQPKLKINTAEFWKTEEAGQAFDRMYTATKDGLKHRFEWVIAQNFVTMLQIPDEGNPELFTDF
jgi:predicted acylesterase/phospholipase RssA